ncbi:copper amine oxidase N-terminal domain-containing protein [Paenibacillus sp. CN-4]|uniref:copper amine oxidase N-terminal domain-containing protein n=1 Tax=Paenibacillus nanchangensis TaxID=3348343 RepID=UPI003978DB2C
MKNKRILSAALAAFLSCVPAAASFASHSPAIVVNSKAVNTEVQPILKDGVTLVPIKTIAGLPNTAITWDNTAKTVTVVNQSTQQKSIFQLNSKNAKIGGKQKEIEVPVSLVNGSVFVPLRAIGEASGAIVLWAPQKQTVYIAKPSDKTVQALASADLSVRRKAAVSETPKIDALPGFNSNRERNSHDVFYFPRGEAGQYFYLYGDVIEYHQIKSNIDYKIWVAKAGSSKDPIKLINNQEGLAFKTPVGVISEQGTRPKIAGEYVYYNMDIMGGIARYGLVSSKGEVTGLGIHYDIDTTEDFFLISEE